MPTTKADTQAMTMAGLNLIQQALSIYDSDLRLVVSNERFRSMFDLPEHLVKRGADFDETIRFLVKRGEYGDVEDVEGFVRERVDLALAFEPHYIERQMGNGRWISVEGSPLPQGGWVAVYTDITSVKRQEELLRTRSEALSGQLLSRAEELATANRKLESSVIALEEAKRQLTEIEARTRLTTEMMPAHIAHVGPDRRYTYSNRRLSTVMPGSLPDPVGIHAAEVLGEQPWSAIETHLDRAFAGQSSVFEFTHEPSSRRIRVALTPDQSAGGVYILSMDITEETQARTALQQTRRRELAAQMVSGLAHDFSNLLTIVLGAQSKLNTMTMPAEAEGLVNATLSAARRGGELLDRIADMTGHRAPHPGPTSPGKFLADLEPLARSTLPAGISLEVENLLPDSPLLLDAGLLQDALLNLVLNARDACGESGTIVLSARSVQDTWCEFEVRDTGGGFSEAALTHALDPFFTTKGDDGSGLGLAMVYDTVKLSGGRVRVENAQGGAQVTLRLPLKRVPHIEPSGLALLVEDSELIRTQLREMLIELGHNVVEASSAEEALSLAETIPDISVILSDVSLEGEATGVDLVKALGGNRPPCFLMTSLPETDPLFRSAIEAAPVLRKPFEKGVLAGYLGKEQAR